METESVLPDCKVGPIQKIVKSCYHLAVGEELRKWG